MIDAKINREQQLAKNKDLATRVVELEAENSVLRNKRYNVEKRPEIPRTEVESTVPEVNAQMHYVNPTIDMTRPGPALPKYYPLSQSPSLHTLNALFKKDKKNYTSDLEKSIFEPLWHSKLPIDTPGMTY